MKERRRRVSVPVQFLLVLRLRGLDHEGASHRPAHGGSVEAEVHQPLGNVDRLHTRGLLEVAHVDDELVGNLLLNLRKRLHTQYSLAHSGTRFPCYLGMDINAETQ